MQNDENGRNKQRRLELLMAQAQDGDSSAYRLLLEELELRAKAFSRAFNARAGKNDPGDWEDAVQEILLAVHEKRHTFDPSQPLLPWFYALARYKMIDRYRARKRRWFSLPTIPDYDLELIADVESTLPAQLPGQLASEALADLQTLMQLLNEKQRSALLLVKFEGLSVAEAAQKLGFSESDIKVSVHRALKILRNKLEQGRGGGSGS